MMRGEVDEKGEPRHGNTLLILLNAHHEPISFRLSTPIPEAQWEPLLDTAQFPGKLSDTKGGTVYEILERSVAVLRLTTPAKKEERKEGFVATDLVEVEDRSKP
jgi:glycogen operon protein